MSPVWLLCVSLSTNTTLRWGGQKFGLMLQQPAQIENTLINTAGSKYFSESCHIYLIHYFGN